ncbi:hypothetical protein HDU99_002185 [Rhizoclosmatium hyalinum]|nr:hypothetical protein HDU99_002185 [Rhizoclosmatium hyalinum]
MQKRWSTEAHYHITTPGTDEFYFSAGQWSPDGTCLLTLDSSRTVRLFNTPASLFDAAADPGPRDAALVLTRADPIYAAAWAPGMRSADPESCVFALATRDHPLLLIDAYTGLVRGKYTALADGDMTTAPHSLAFSPDGTTLYGGMENKIAVFDINIQGNNPLSYLNTTPTRKSMYGQKGLLSHLSTSPFHPTLLLASSYSKSFAVYDTTCGESVALISGIPGTGVTQAEFSAADASLILVASRRSNVIQGYDARNLADGAPLFELPRPGNTNQRIAFSQSPDGKLLVTGDSNGNVLVYDLVEASRSSASSKGNDGNMTDIGDTTTNTVLINATKLSDEAVGSAVVHPYYYPDSESGKTTYWMAAVTGERRQLSIPGSNYQDSDTDSDMETDHVETRRTGVSAEINMFQITK